MADRRSDGAITYLDFSENQKTSFGEIKVLSDESGRSLYLDDSEQLRLEDLNEIGILVFSNEDLHVVSADGFKSKAKKVALAAPMYEIRRYIGRIGILASNGI